MPLGPDVRFVTRKWPPAIGGMETYSVRITEEIAKRAKIDVIALPGRCSGRPPSALAFPGFAAQVTARLLTSPFARVVHVADLASWPFAWVASLRHRRSRIVISAHGSDVSAAFRAGWLAMVYRFYLKLGSALLPGARIIANSRYVAELAKRAGFGHATIIPLGTDFSSERSRERRDLLYVGRISARKGLRFLVEEVLPRLSQDVRIRVAGTVWQESERPLLKHRQIDYLGALPPDELAEEYARAAAVLIPTRESEGFGLVAVEAAACGAFVIASAHSGLIDVVQPPIGITVPANDPIAWANAIRNALSHMGRGDPERSKAAQEKVETVYRWPLVADATWSVYNA